MAASHFQTLLEKKIGEEIDNRAFSLGNGDATDYPRYMESVGYIRGLKAALSFCTDIERDSDR